MQVDQVAFIQGIINAHADGDISKTAKDKLLNAVYSISSPGPFRRLECKYSDLLHLLVDAESDWAQLAGLWKHIGASLSSGICVANSW